jgi:hypothetical protein
MKKKNRVSTMLAEYKKLKLIVLFVQTVVAQGLVKIAFNNDEYQDSSDQLIHEDCFENLWRDKMSFARYGAA